MTDWNQNGKHDITDSYIDYKIYKDMSSGNTSMGTFFPGYANVFDLLYFPAVCICYSFICG